MKQFILLFTLLVCNFSIAQINFDRYRTIMAAGPIPEDFSKITSEKVQDEKTKGRDGLSTKQEGEFSTMIHYGLDNILHSGLCVYGDPLSNYISDVAKFLLKDDPELYKKLRFYVIKSNVANAFSTDQGIVVFTTGLVSQFANEAQLAFVIAHEITHYTENHVVQTFDYNSKNRYKDGYIEKMSTYSKDKEFDADKAAVALCHKAGYSDNEVYNSFDVLMYSHLPFDEIEFPISYYDSELFFIPKNLYPTEKFEIKTDEDYNDNLSTHPNIKKRKDTVNVILSELDNWGDKSFILDEARFKEVSSIARFESVRTQILEAQYVDALYSIFLLEREFPHSFYLNKMKAHAWLGLYHLKSENNISDAVKKTSELEGESGTLHFLIKKMSQDALGTLALREIYDIKKIYHDDYEINYLYEKLISKLAYSKSFKLDNFSTKNFETASKEFIDSQEAKKTDTITETTENKKQTKYERIKKTKDVNVVENFDSTKYYQYGLSDLVVDEAFKTIFKKYEAEREAEEKEEERLNNLTRAERRKEFELKEKEKPKPSLDQLIIVEPTVISYHKGEIDYAKSDALEKNLDEAITYSAEDAGVKLTNIDRSMLGEGGTEAFNERNTLFTLINQLYSTESTSDGTLPVDYELLKELKAHYNVDNIMFTFVEHYYQPRIHPGGVIGMIFLPPVLPLYLIRGFALANNTEMTNIVINSEEGTIVMASTNFSRSPVKKWHLRSQMYNVFKQL